MNQIEIRNANINDTKEIVQLIIDSWNKTYKGIISQIYLDHMKKNKNEMLKKMTDEFNKKVVTIKDVNTRKQQTLKLPELLLFIK